VALNQKLEKELNDQMKREFYAAYMYLSMAAYCHSRNLSGFAHWLELQAREELGHALRFYRHLEERSGKIELQAIEQPPSSFPSPLELMERVKSHEEMVTREINRIYALAVEEKDYATQTFLHWFIDEQVEEEKMATFWVERLKLAADDKSALLLIDKEMGARTEAE
jgi:ferritin